MKLFRIFLFWICITIVLTSCLDDGDIAGSSPNTWICTINTDGSDLNYLYEGNGNAQYSYDGSKIIIGIDDYGFKIIDAEIGTIIVNIDTLLNTSYYSFSNTNKICFASYCDVTNSSDLFTLNTNDYIVENVTFTDSISENFPAFSSISNRIVYEKIVGYQSSLNLLNLITNLTTNIFSV